MPGAKTKPKSPSKPSTSGKTPPSIPSSSRRKGTNPRRRRRPGTVAIREMKYYMRTTHLLIQKLPFCRLVRETLHHIHPYNEIRWQKAALECLQEAAETYIVGVLADANLCALHTKRVTLMVRDIHLIMRLRGISST